MNEPIIALDLETTGLDPSRHQILSIGAANFLGGNSFYCEVEWKEVTVTVEALRINRFNLLGNEQLARFPIQEACKMLFDWLPFDSGMIIMGKQPKFDRTFLHTAWPHNEIHFPFHYRTLDLNSIIRFIAIQNKNDFIAEREKISVKANELFKQERPEVFSSGEHNALYDALWNIYVLKVLQSYIKLGTLI